MTMLIILNVLLLACIAVLVWFLLRGHALQSRSAEQAGSSPILSVRQIGARLPRLNMERVKVFLRYLPWRSMIELTVIGVWAMYVGRPFLDLNPHVWPMGRETGIQLNVHYFWVNVQRCGLCALWDGSINGGVPALANPFGGELHPIVALTTLGWGVINGAKLALVICLWMTGAAQWWIAKSLKLGWLPRLWSAGAAVAGGHIAARMATGQFTVVLSVATCSLALAAALHLATTNRWRSAAVLALFGGLSIMSGHGYVPLNLVAWTPAFLFIVFDSHLRLRPIWRKYAVAVGLSLLIAGVFLVPVLHFLPNFTKDSDTTFSRAQPIEYAPINLVVSDYEFQRAEVLGKFDAPELFGMYIGWVPVILAVLSLRFARRQDAPLLLCLAGGIALSFIMGSAILLKALGPVAPFLSGFRHPSLSGLLTVPGILALAAYGLDGLLKLPWPRVDISSHTQRTLTFSLGMILLIPLTLSLMAEYEFTRHFYGTDNFEEHYQNYSGALDKLKEPGLQWISLPYGEHYFIESGLEYGLKMTEVSWPASWKDRTLPEPRIVVSRQGEYPGTTIIGEFEGMLIRLYPDRSYAYVESGQRQISCLAIGQGGDLSATCTTDQPGKLILQEYASNNWQVQRDGVSVPLVANQWLTVEAPAGTHTYEFRYRPWDVIIGVIITLVGLALTGWLWLRAPDRHSPTELPASAETP